MSSDARENDGPAEQAAAPERLGIVDRVRAAAAWPIGTPRRKAVTAAASTAAVGAVLLLAFSGGEPELTPQQKLHVAFLHLDRGDIDDAALFAVDLRASQALPIGDLGDPSYILGLAAVDAAEKSWGDKRRRYYLIAAAYLDESRDYGFPPDRAHEGSYHLGRSLLFAGQYDQAAVALEEALELNADRALELHDLAAEAYASLPTPRWDAALEHNAQFLAFAELPPDDRIVGLLRRAQLLVGAGRPTEARAALVQIAADAPRKAERLTLEGEILLNEARALAAAPDASPDTVVAQVRSAIAVLRDAQAADDLQSQATSGAMLLIVRGLRMLGERPAALDQAQQTIKRFPETPTSLAATFEQAELLRELGRDQESLASYALVFEQLKESPGWMNRWLPLESLRAQALAAQQSLLDAQRFDSAVKLSKLAAPALDQREALLLTARAYEQWGRALLERAVNDPPTAAPARYEEAFAQLRHAGRLYVQLARERLATDEYPELLWSGATNYLAGRDFDSAVKHFQEYLRIEHRARRPLAYLGLGEALLSQDKIDDALRSLDSAVATDPRSAVAYEARLLAARALLRQGAVDKAEAQLLENLENSSLTPTSREWRDSLFDLGRLLHRAGRWDEAIAQLEEAAARYPDDPRAVEALYLTAVAFARAAAAHGEKFSSDATIQQQLAHSREEDRLWNASLAAYETALAGLNALQDQRALSAGEAGMLRNCAFGRGSTMFQLARYDDAVRAYLAAVNRYQRQPEALEAYVQLFECYRRLDQQQEARSAIEQARLVLGQLPDDAGFTQVTIRSKPEWAGLLDALAQY